MRVWKACSKKIGPLFTDDRVAQSVIGLLIEGGGCVIPIQACRFQSFFIVQQCLSFSGRAVQRANVEGNIPLPLCSFLGNDVHVIFRILVIFEMLAGTAKLAEES